MKDNFFKKKNQIKSGKIQVSKKQFYVTSYLPVILDKTNANGIK